MTAGNRPAERGVRSWSLGTPPLRPYPDPVGLVEREEELAILGSAFEQASNGDGSGVAVIGDAGAGKSVLLDAAIAAAPDLRLLRGSCDPLRTPRPLGPFRDLAAVTGLGALLRGEDVLLSDLCEQMYDAVRSTPTVLVVEDLHWVDEASVDVLRFLARRIDSMPLALLVSYRDHEVGPRHSVRPLLGDFARLDGLSTLSLRPLSKDGVHGLLAGTGLDPSRVHALTGGNPFFVTEVAKNPDRPMPMSVRDAVLARTTDVTPEDFEVLQLTATAPDRLDDRLLPALGVDLPTLRRLDATGLLTRSRGGLVYRHELARQALESTIPPGGEPGLHARLLQALEKIEPPEPALLTHHAVGARDSTRAARYAKVAAREAIRAGSHTEAVAFFQTALDHLEGAPPAERAELLHQLGYQQYMTSRLQDAIANVSATFPLWEQAGDAAGLSAAHEAVALFEYYNARRRDAEAHADRAASIVREPGPELTYGLARATRGYLAYHRSEFDLALKCSDDATRIADRERHGELALRSRFVESASALAGGDEEARARLAKHIETARAHDWDELASACYSNLAYLDVEQRRFRAAEHVLDESLPFTTERDIPICRHWQTGVRSRLHLSNGHWSAALEDAEHVLDGEGMPLATLWPLLVTALVPLRRGDENAPTASFEAAWELADRLDEPLRRLAVLSALAERMWMTELADVRVTDVAVSALDRLAGHARIRLGRWGSRPVAGQARAAGEAAGIGRRAVPARPRRAPGGGRLVVAPAGGSVRRGHGVG